MWEMIGDERRAQILSSELITAAFIFSLVLVFAFLSWDTSVKKILRSEVLFEMDDSATNAIEKLVRTSGFPVAWESLPVDDVLSIGLVNESRVLDPGKVLRFLDIMENETCTDTLINPCYNASDSDTFDITKYECNKHFMGVGDYEFYFTVTDLDDNILSLGGVNCSTGISPMDYDYLTNMKRSAVLGDDVVKISFMVWT